MHSNKACHCKRGEKRFAILNMLIIIIIIKHTSKMCCLCSISEGIILKVFFVFVKSSPRIVMCGHRLCLMSNVNTIRNHLSCGATFENVAVM